ncbi:MAG: PaaI family thioesterase [Nocardioides sp.]
MTDAPAPAEDQKNDQKIDQQIDVAEFVAAMPQGMGGLNERMGIELVEVSPTRIVGTMPVEGNTQPYGLLHGGASVVLAETLGSVGSALHAQPDRVAVGVDINATHHRGATSGTVTGVATPVHLGRSMASFEVVITDERGKRVCTSRITCALVPADALKSSAPDRQTD